MVSHLVHVDAVHIHAKLVSLRPSLHSSIYFSRLHVCMDQIRDAIKIATMNIYISLYQLFNHDNSSLLFFP